MPDQFLKVNDYPDLVRDPSTGAIIRRNPDGYQAYLDRRRAQEERDTKINKLEADMLEIKALLLQLINKDK